MHSTFLAGASARTPLGTPRCEAAIGASTDLNELLRALSGESETAPMPPPPAPLELEARSCCLDWTADVRRADIAAWFALGGEGPVHAGCMGPSPAPAPPLPPQEEPEPWLRASSSTLQLIPSPPPSPRCSRPGPLQLQASGLQVAMGCGDQLYWQQPLSPMLGGSLCSSQC
jgi:hypothetical protein